MVINTPTICLLTILTYWDSFLLYKIESRSTFSSQLTSGLTLLSTFKYDSKGRKFSKDLEFLNELTDSSIFTSESFVTESMNVHNCCSLSISLSSTTSSSIFGMSLDGLNLDGDGGSLKHLKLVFTGWILLRVLRMMFSHIGIGRVSSEPKILPAFKGMISWKLQRKRQRHHLVISDIQ